jgi:hypothetical protein
VSKEDIFLKLVWSVPTPDQIAQMGDLQRGYAGVEVAAA